MSDNWWTDYQQNKRLRGLEDDLSSVSASLASARSSQRKLNAELSKVRGSLEQRLDRLSAAFDAFVEISDLRVTLGLFDAQGRVRHQARQLLAAAGPEGEVSDVDGYWLPPALSALRVGVDGVTDTESLDLARGRDAERAAIFYILGAGLLGGRTTVTEAMLADALPVPGTTQPRFQRAMWTLAADGFFGEAGWELVRRRGTEFVHALPADRRAGAVDGIRSIATKGAKVTSVPRDIEGLGDLGSALAAAAGLEAMRTWVEETLEARTNEPPAEVDPAVRPVVELLVDEGSPVELPLLQRERELRAVIEGKGSQPPAWDGSAGDTVDLLRADLADAAHPNRRAVALRSCGELVVAAAEKLAATARTDAPYRVQARTRQGLVTITGDGPDAGSLAKARSRIDSSTQVNSQRRVTAGVAGGVALVFLVLGIVAGWGWLLIAAAAPVVAIVQWRTDVRERQEAAATAVTMHASFAKDIEERVSALTACRAELIERQPKIDEDVKAIREALR